MHFMNFQRNDTVDFIFAENKGGRLHYACTDILTMFQGQILNLTLLSVYWVSQVGLLTPLTFTQHRSSPLTDFTSSAYFLLSTGQVRQGC